MHSLPVADSRISLPNDGPTGEPQVPSPALGPLAFGVTLRRLRTGQGFSLSKLAELVFYSKGYLSKVENGDKPPTLDLATRCDDALGAGGDLVGLVPEGQRRSRAEAPVRPAQLPADVRGFTGRDDQVRQVESYLSNGAGVVVVSGPPGVGKTAFALHCGHRLQERFPDGSLFVDLRGYDPSGEPVQPADVLDDFLRALGVAQDAIPAKLEARSALFRTRLMGRRFLVMLDNAAASEQVRPLLPGLPGCLVMATSRNWLSGLTARDGGFRVSLGPLSRADAIELLRYAMGNDRADREPDALGELARHCSYLPLALRVAAERVVVRPYLHLAELVDDLSEERNRLDLLSTEDDELSAVRAVFAWSYQALDPDVAKIFRFLGLHPTPELSLEAVAALSDATTGETRTALGVLGSMNLLEETSRNRYRLHDLLQVYARERVTIEEPVAERASAVRRLIGWYLRTADGASRQIGPPRVQERVDLPRVTGTPPLFATRHAAVRWCDTECTNLVAVVRQALEQGDAVAAWQIPVALWTYFHLRKPWGSWFDALALGLEAARRVHDRGAEAWVHNDLAAACMDLRRLDEALAHLNQVRLLRQGLDVDPWTEAWTTTTRGFVHRARGDWANACQYHQHAYDLYQRIDEEFGKGLAAACLGEIAHRLGKVERSVELLTEAHGVFHRLQDAHAEGFVLDNLASALDGAGRTDEALDVLEHALALKRQCGSERGEATTLDHRGRLLAQVGRLDEAGDAWRDALVILEGLGDPQATDVRARIDQVSSGGNRSTLVE